MPGGIIGTNNAGMISSLVKREIVYQKGVIAVGTQIAPQDSVIKKIMDYHGKPYIPKSEFTHEIAKAADEEQIIVVGLDCASIHEEQDAKGWVDALSKQFPQPSIIVLENITELSSPELQDILIHSWKDKTKYLVYLTWDIDKREVFDKIWNPKDGFIKIDNYHEWKEKYKKKYVRKKIIEKYNELTALKCEFLKKNNHDSQ